jgi:hypothetical protein
MTSVDELILTLAAGVGLASAAIHFALCFQRPRSAYHLTFALMMLVMCPFQLIVARLAASPTWPEIIALSRVGAALAIILIVLFAAFVRQYSRLRLRSAYFWVYVAMSATWLAFDLAAPAGLLYTSVAATRRPGVSPFGIAWQVFNWLTVLWGTSVGWRVLRRGERRRGGILVLGGSLLLVTVSLDVLRNLLGWGLPYLGGFGLVAFSLLLSMELVLDFRESERRLNERIAAVHALRDQLNTPLQTLRFGLETLPARSPEDHRRVDRLRRAVTRLSHVSRDLRR